MQSSKHEPCIIQTQLAKPNPFFFLFGRAIPPHWSSWKILQNKLKHDLACDFGCSIVDMIDV